MRKIKMDKRKKRTKFAYLVKGHYLKRDEKSYFSIFVVCKRELKCCKLSFSKELRDFNVLGDNGYNYNIIQHIEELSYHKGMDKHASITLQ